MAVEIEVKKVDSQGRLILPSDWRADELKQANEVYVIKRKGYLKIVPKQRVDLSKFFDKADLEIDAISDWQSFEKTRAENRT
ncbi:MAG: AbrB family transcriptional regulator [Thaumarchaeota archaeon]|nr:AbrB family transcriptional regulator [Nitrososphaerota archaeon]